MIAGAKKHGKKARIQKRAGKTRRRPKKAALDIFSEKSVDSVTVEEITKKADLGRGTLYPALCPQGGNCCYSGR
jgi:hypothetical protein